MRRILFAVALAGLSTLTYASGFKLSSPEIKANQHDTQELRVQRFWLLGREQIARAQMERSAQGHQELCRDRVRPRCADRLGLVALGGHQHPG